MSILGPRLYYAALWTLRVPAALNRNGEGIWPVPVIEKVMLELNAGARRST